MVYTLFPPKQIFF